MANPVVEHMKARKQMMTRIWTLYDQIPQRHKKKAQKLIDDWHNGKISYQTLLKELRKLAHD